MKVRTLLVAAVMFFALSAAAFAQATFSVGSTPVTAVIANGLTERTGDIVFTVTSGTSFDGTISINYSGVAITNNVVDDFPVGITVTGTGVAWTATHPTVNSTTTADSLKAGILVITVPAGGVVGDIIRVQGTRVAVANTGLTSLNAQISTTVNSITAGQTVVQVISAISPGIVPVEEEEVLTITSTDPPSTATAHMIAKEVFLNAFGGATEPGSYPVAAPPANGALMVRFTLSTLPPANLTLSFDATIPATEDTSATWVYCDAKGNQIDPVEITSESTPPLYVWYKLTTDSDATKIEELIVPVHLAFDGTVVGASNIQYTITTAPIGTSKVTPDEPSYIPRYTVSESAATDLIIFQGANTVMLIPYANVAVDINYDTGIAISNTSEDPGSKIIGYDEAVPQPGAFTVYFFPQSGTNFSVSSTAAGFPGTGLDATGKIPAGGTFVALLSALVKAAQTANPTVTIPDDFTGYLIIVTTFTNGHGLATVSNFQTYTQASPVLIIDGSRAAEKGLNN